MHVDIQSFLLYLKSKLLNMLGRLVLWQDKFTYFHWLDLDRLWFLFLVYVFPGIVLKTTLIPKTEDGLRMLLSLMAAWQTRF